MTHIHDGGAILGEKDSPVRLSLRRKLGWSLVGVVFGTLAINAVPSSNTFYLIAASEVGQQVVETPEAQEVLDLLKAKIKDMLAVD
jgi:hypothetical protein